MKMINKYSLLVFCALSLALVGCDEDVTRELSPAVNPASTNVNFSSDNSASVAVGLEDKSFDVIVTRENANDAQTVGIISSANPEAKPLFDVPSTVSFKAGENSTVLSIKVNDGIELLKSYKLTLKIDPSQTNPYTQQDVYPTIELNVVKEDFAPYAKGTYTTMFFEESWEAILEYSPATDAYRFKNCWVEGFDVTFNWKDKGEVVTMIGSKSGGYIVVVTGYMHSKYGMVSAYYSGCTYDAAQQLFTFPISWRVSAGSFGDMPDSFQITELY